LERTRIFLADLPRLQREIITQILRSQSDLDVVAEAAQDESLLQRVERECADVLVIGRDDPGLAAALLERQPRMRVVAVARRGRECWLYELRPQRVALGEISSRRLLELVRGQPLSTCEPDR
jgi:DNA-binding NarL/FixJ family response regulator